MEKEFANAIWDTRWASEENATVSHCLYVSKNDFIDFMYFVCWNGMSVGLQIVVSAGGFCSRRGIGVRLSVRFKRIHVVRARGQRKIVILGDENGESGWRIIVGLLEKKAAFMLKTGAYGLKPCLGLLNRRSTTACILLKALGLHT